MRRPGSIMWTLALLTAACALVPATPAAAAPSPSGVTISGLDLHDGTIVESGGMFHLYGTMYGCGFQWGAPSPWCGFGVSRARSLAGPWTAPVPLFAPSKGSPYAQMSWQELCGDTGLGCFNPRMIQRSGWGTNDGAWILWFNAPADYARDRANAYYAMTCTGPTGPCGATEAAIVKPSMHDCTGNGDFSLVRDDPRPPVMLCTKADQTLASERLLPSGTGGAGEGRQRLAGLERTESPGAYRDARTGRWIMTYNDPNCGYCTGTPTSYAIAAAPDGEWTAPGNSDPDWGAPPHGRRAISATSCGGQGRTVVTLAGQAYQFIDLWLGTANETHAGIRLEPLIYRGEAEPGRPLAAFMPWTCGADAEGHGQRGTAAPRP